MELAPLPSIHARELLVAAALPVDDLDDPSITMLGAFDHGRLVGTIGLQTCGEVGLLRSLAVAAEHRGRGVAGALCARLFALARERSLGVLYLLTTSAADYFVRHGFAVIPRDDAPAAIRASAQFSSMCPSSATVMRRYDR
jgi:amino-acid N-acetyltransferase